MMQILDPTYTLRVEVRDKLTVTDAVHGHNFYNGLTGATGCDVVLAKVKGALDAAGLKFVTVTLERFEHK